MGKVIKKKVKKKKELPVRYSKGHKKVKKKKELPVRYSKGHKKFLKAKDLATDALHLIRKKKVTAKDYEDAYELFMEAVEILPKEVTGFQSNLQGFIPKSLKESRALILTCMNSAGVALFKRALFGKENWISVSNHFMEFSQFADEFDADYLSDYALSYSMLATGYGILADAKKDAKEEKFKDAIAKCSDANDSLNSISDVPMLSELKKILSIKISERLLSYEIDYAIYKKNYLNMKIWRGFLNLCNRYGSQLSELDGFEVLEIKRDLIWDIAKIAHTAYIISNIDPKELPHIISKYSAAGLLSVSLFEISGNSEYEEESQVCYKQSMDIEKQIGYDGDLYERIKRKDTQRQFDEEEEKMSAFMESGLPFLKEKSSFKDIDIDKEMKDMEKQLQSEVKTAKKAETAKHAELLERIKRDLAAEAS